MMEKFTVKISNQEIVVWEKDYEKAMRKAIKTDTGKDKVFAILSVCSKEGDKEEDEYLFHIEYMQENGYFEGFETHYLD